MHSPTYVRETDVPHALALLFLSSHLCYNPYLSLRDFSTYNILIDLLPLSHTNPLHHNPLKVIQLFQILGF